MASAISRIIAGYHRARTAREARMRRFLAGEEPYVVLQRADRRRITRCRTPQESLDANLALFEAELDAPSDHLPFLEPWFGTGVYANAFGCPYVWRDGESPAVRYRYHTLAEVRDIETPDWREAEICRLVLDGIRFLKQETCAELPISLTDTQSPFDTATLIVDAGEVFLGCHIEAETVKRFLDAITSVIVDFSRAQMEEIGRDLAAQPGHYMPSLPGGPGISISDDNLAVASPATNREIAFPAYRRLAAAFGGVALHSCGNWAETMRMVRRQEGIILVDCALSPAVDPTPCRPEVVRDAMQGKGIPLKVRLGNDLGPARPLLEAVFDPRLSLAVEIPLDESPGKAQANYTALRRLLDQLRKKAVV